MHWDEHTDKSIPICSNMKQFFELQVRYGMISKAVQLEVSDRTGKHYMYVHLEFELITLANLIQLFIKTNHPV